MTLHVTSHAISRYRTRVAPVDDDAARAALSSPVIVKAAEFGARCVRLPTGQRIVIEDHHVATVLPASKRPRPTYRPRLREVHQ